MHIRERAIGAATVLDVAGHTTMGRDAKQVGTSIDSLVARAHSRVLINLTRRIDEPLTITKTEHRV